MILLLVRALSLILSFSSLAAFAKGTIVPPPNPAVEVVINFPYGGRVDWATNGQVFYDRQVSSAQVLTYTANPDGTHVTPLTLPVSTEFNVGNPAVAPNMQSILLQVASASGYNANPGIGYSNNIYLGVLSGNAVTSWKALTHLGNTGYVLHPKFSPSGTRIAWTQSSSQGGFPSGSQWLIVWANSDGTNIQTANPLGALHFYEFGSWSDDETLYLVATDQNNSVFKNIYSFNVVTGVLKKITNTTATWFEFPQVRNGIMAYVSSEATGSTPITNQWYPLDLWTRNPDGTNPKRITTYNLPGSPQAYAFKVADISWNAAGTQLAGLIYSWPQRSEAIGIFTPSLAP